MNRGRAALEAQAASTEGAPLPAAGPPPTTRPGDPAGIGLWRPTFGARPVAPRCLPSPAHGPRCARLAPPKGGGL